MDGTGKPAVFDIKVLSPLTPVSLNNASTSVVAAAYAAECRKHYADDTRCQELGWMCIDPFSCGNIWQQAEAQGVFSWLAFLLAISQAIPKPKMLAEIYGRLNMSMLTKCRTSPIGMAESYGALGEEASAIISSITLRLATSTCKPKLVVLNDIMAG
ncbi:hypothetical protein EMCRGX_G013455 [Ephydatia muelleri]